MNRFTCLLVVLAVVGTASATPITIWMNDFDTLDGVTTRAPVSAPYLYDGGAWGDVPLDVTGYMVMDIQMCDLQAEQAYDMTYGDITITLQMEGDWLIPDETTGFWVRFYSRAWNGTEWAFSGGQNYFYDVEHTSELYGFGPGWQTFTRSVDDWNETDWLGPYYSDQIYKFRVDCVTWDPGLTPYRFGISYLDIVAPECPDDIDGDDDVDLADLAMLLGEYGCMPVESALYDTAGFEAFSPGDLNGQDGWEAVIGAGLHQIIADPTASGMGQVLELDAAFTDDLIAVQRLLDAPVTDNIIVYEWDQYRPDLDENIWMCDDYNYDGWWSLQWDQTLDIVPGPIWGGGIPLTAGVWQHIRFDLDLTNGSASVSVDGSDPATMNYTFDDIKGIELEIQGTDAGTGQGPIYFDNLVVKLRQICPIDYDEDGDTDLSDLAQLLGSYGCGVLP
jgi:hypothetical protein